MKALICFDKIQDWMESYSIFKCYNDLTSVLIIYKENTRNNEVSVMDHFNEFKNNIGFQYLKVEPWDFFITIEREMKSLNNGDLFVAPFIRYRSIWKLVPRARNNGVTTIHLSESLPDSFGLTGYRLGFRWGHSPSLSKMIKNSISIPIMYIYALTHKPDICFYNMAPQIENHFVKETRKAEIPSLSLSKRETLQYLFGDRKRPLIVAGFGYDIKKIANAYHLDRYIATSKNMEIIIDNVLYPLSEFICAEDILIGGFADKIIGYNSTAICWAYRIGGVEIECFEAPGLDETFGSYNFYSRKTLAKCGIQLKSPCHDMFE